MLKVVDLPRHGAERNRCPRQGCEAHLGFRRIFPCCSKHLPSRRLPGEIAGKSSNVAFAARHIVQVHRTELSTGSCNVIATVMDGKPQQYSCLETHPELIKQPTHISGRTTSPKSAACIVPTPTTLTARSTRALSSSTATPTKPPLWSAALTSSGASRVSRLCIRERASPSRHLYTRCPYR